MRIILLGEPMGLFIANEPGELSEVKTFTSAIAGAEYNVAVGLARLGHEPAYCTRLGDDPFGEKILAGLRANGIDTGLVLRAPGELTGFMMKSSTDRGDPKIAYYRKGSAASRMGERDADGLNLSGCGRLHVTGIFPAASESTLSAVKRLMARAREMRLPISFDPNLRPQLWKDEAVMRDTLNELARGVETVLPGVAEGELLSGRKGPEAVADFYHGMGVRNVVVKVGAQGAYYSQADGESGYAPGFPVRKVVDTVGAGDGFAAGVVSALAEGLSLREAACRGNVIGAVQVAHKGDNEGLPTRAELEAILREGTA